MIGWGECVAGEGPFYAPETVETAWHIMRDFLWPTLPGGNSLQPRTFGHCCPRFAATTWPRPDLKRPSGTPRPSRRAPALEADRRHAEEIACGVSIGLKDTDDELDRTVERELAAGYQRIKIKIKPGRDVAPVSMLRQRFPRIHLMVDANSAYRLEDAPLLQQLEPTT